MGVEKDGLVERKIDRWQQELLDTGRRNRMIHYRETKRTTLRILEPGDTELFTDLAVGEKTLTFRRPVSRESDFRTYAMLALLETLSYALPVHTGDIQADGTVMERERTLANLRTRARLAQEEQGTNILYLSFGFILWRENSRAGSPWMKSPLLLMPVELGLKSFRAPYTLRKTDEEITVNPTLAYLYSRDFGLELPAFELKNRHSYEEYLDQIGEMAEERGWRLVREVSLGLLSFLKISMYHDLCANRARMLAHPVIRAISGDTEAVGGIPPQAAGFDFDRTQPRDWYEVSDADSSQQEAILLSRLGVSLVMQGPPGTGKSQTITNMIAEALGAGKKVLFVSEKAAALQVVHKRLAEAQLDDFCLALHSYKANKKEIIGQIGANLRLKAEEPGDAYPEELTELLRDRLFLNTYAEELHQPVAPLGESPYRVLGLLGGLADVPMPAFFLENPAAVTREQLSSMLYVTVILERALHDMGGKLSENPWAGTSARSAGELFRQEMLAASGTLPELLRELEGRLRRFGDSYGIFPAKSFAEAGQGLDRLAAVLALPAFPAAWLEEGRRNSLRERAVREEKKDQAERLHAGRLDAALDRIRANWQMASMMLSAEELETVSDAAGEAAGPAVTEHIRTAVQELEKLADLLAETGGLYAEAEALLQTEEPDTPDAVLRSCRLLSLLADAPDMEAAWFDIRRTEWYLAQIGELEQHRDSLRQKRERLLENWEPAILSLDAAGMLNRFKTDYTGFWHRLKGEYREDVRRLRMCARTVGAQLPEDVMIDALQQVCGIREEEAWFAAHEADWRRVFPLQYRGAETDCGRIAAGIRRAAEIAGLFPYGGIPDALIAVIGQIGGSIALSARVRGLADRLREEEIRTALTRLQEVCLTEKDGTGLRRGGNAALSLGGTWLPALRARIARLQAGADLACRLDAARIAGAVTGAELRLLEKDIALIREEDAWFLENIPDMAAALPAGQAEGSGTMADALTRAGRILETYEAMAEKDETAALTALFGSRYTGSSTDWQAIRQELDTLDGLVKKGMFRGLESFAAAVSGDAAVRRRAEEELRELQALFAGTEPKLAYFETLFPEQSFRDMPMAGAADRYENCREHFEDLGRWLDYVQAREDCDRQGLADFTAYLAEQDNTVRDVRRAFERSFYTQWLNGVIGQVPAVQSFRRKVHEQRLEQFGRLDVRQFALARERIRRNIIRTFPDADALTGPRSQLRILRHEMEKKRQHMPLRRLFRQIPDLLLTLKPCLMMSPLSAAYFLDAEDYHFDMVIFDEASQIFPQDAIGAILRADQVIIAGDSRQLPPTNFFSVSTGSQAEGESEEDFPEDEVYESVLEEAARVLPNRTLRWHYRSRHEQLIAFSNREIYHGELVTFPGSSERRPDTGVELVFVEDGFYESGGRNCNLPEAQRCAALVKEHIDRHPERSLGIIAFSERQQQAISLEIRKFREQNPLYEAFFREDREEAFFVKNLENVQGDERDTILFSVGYARTKAQKAAGRPMAMRFGPLGLPGGERRLNVAITRARINVKLVSSILPADIDPARTQSEGIRMLRAYLGFALDDGTAAPSVRQVRVRDDFADVVSAFIEEHGYRVKKHVGCSEYRIDIAVEDPGEPGRWAAGITCDGPSYASARTARDRDRLRGAVLRQMGWRLYRMWSVEWLRSPEAEKEKLLQFIDQAVTASAARRKAGMAEALSQPHGQ